MYQKIAQKNFEIRELHQSSSIFEHVHNGCESPYASSSRPTVGQHLPRAAGRSHSYSYELANNTMKKSDEIKLIKLIIKQIGGTKPPIRIPRGKRPFHACRGASTRRPKRPPVYVGPSTVGKFSIIKGHIK